jgi:hypothetical protein
MTLLSKQLQSSPPQFQTVMVLAPTVIQQIEGMIDEPGPQYSKLRSAINAITEAGHQIKYDKPLHHAVFDTARKDYLRELVAQLRKKFETLPELAALYHMLTPRLYIGKTLEEVASCPELEKCLERVVSHFCKAPTSTEKPLFSREEVTNEWRFLRVLVWNMRDKKKTVEKTTVLEVDSKQSDSADDEEFEFGSEKAKTITIQVQVGLEAGDFIAACLGPQADQASDTTFPCFLQYIMRAYAIAIFSTAECERVFSKLKLVKTKLRNRLSQKTLEQLLQISLNGPPPSEFVSKGYMKMALTYYFTLKNRNAKPPREYIDLTLMRQLDKLQWGTSCKFPEKEEEGESMTSDRFVSWFASHNNEPEELSTAADATPSTTNAIAITTTNNTNTTETRCQCKPKGGHTNSCPAQPSSSTSSPAPSSHPPTKRPKKSEGDDLNDSLSHLYTDPALSAPTDRAALRDARTRSGRAVVHREFLSYNHLDKKSVAMLRIFS